MEPSQPDPRSTDITSLLFKAVKGLPEEEQRAIFEYFFERGIGMEPPAFVGPFTGAAAEPRGAIQRGPWHEASAMTAIFASQKRMGPERTMIPVRLSEDQHRRLKAWCAEHNFPMAVVVRGLIDRFLDSWEKRAA